MERDDWLIEGERLALRRMRDDDADLALVSRWLSDPRVLEYYEGRDNPHDLEKTRAHYSPRIQAERTVTACLLALNEGGARREIGYMQFYPVADEERREYGLPEGLRVFGADQFIGEPELWNRGLGTEAVRLLLAYLFEQEQAEMVVMDPEAWNTRAIRAYEKCGFKKVKLLPAHERHEGQMRDCWLMVAEREQEG